MNVASQLAQVAVVWEIARDGPSLPEDPDPGVVQIVLGDASVDQRYTVAPGLLTE